MRPRTTSTRPAPEAAGALIGAGPQCRPPPLIPSLGRSRSTPRHAACSSTQLTRSYRFAEPPPPTTTARSPLTRRSPSTSRAWPSSQRCWSPSSSPTSQARAHALRSRGCTCVTRVTCVIRLTFARSRHSSQSRTHSPITHSRPKHPLACSTPLPLPTIARRPRLRPCGSHLWCPNHELQADRTQLRGALHAT